MNVNFRGIGTLVFGLVFLFIAITATGGAGFLLSRNPNPKNIHALMYGAAIMFFVIIPMFLQGGSIKLLMNLTEEDEVNYCEPDRLINNNPG